LRRLALLPKSRPSPSCAGVPLPKHISRQLRAALPAGTPGRREPGAIHAPIRIRLQRDLRFVIPLLPTPACGSACAEASPDRISMHCPSWNGQSRHPAPPARGAHRIARLIVAIQRRASSWSRWRAGGLAGWRAGGLDPCPRVARHRRSPRLDGHSPVSSVAEAREGPAHGGITRSRRRHRPRTNELPSGIISDPGTAALNRASVRSHAIAADLP
jgi:hypothetical protein